MPTTSPLFHISTSHFLILLILIFWPIYWSFHLISAYADSFQIISKSSRNHPKSSEINSKLLQIDPKWCQINLVTLQFIKHHQPIIYQSILGIVVSFNVSSWHQNYQIWPLVSLCPSILGQPISSTFDHWHCRIPQCLITISVDQHNNISYVYWCYYYQHHQTISIMWHFRCLWNVVVSLTPVMCPWHGFDQFYFINIIMISVSSLSLHRSIHLLYHIGWLIMFF